ncbi:rifamycin-inactivating phosphotransferase [Mucilaginibacter pedocola]|uniref:Prodigiosin synthesizing transferase PigC n=1 Tax=Mucilaginibacter pedocola TaxID=1792845 RepID=A0A1S9P782_9SPHI|nr:rifamycin-inactivating phosphotransferase [Mucilaginibacter pedocola]OOQ56799.1 phosphoenolpyruvate synthase [Mucilaginibacter pedocola]
MGKYTLNFGEINKGHINLAGGKAANLGELLLTEGIVVPPGFCVTTQAYGEVTDSTPRLQLLLDELESLTPADRKNVATISANVRKLIEEQPITESVANEIAESIKLSGESIAYAVRSSATAEDLPGASFAGQQDTYLNIIGTDAILKHISKCWASLFTERAVLYRMQNGFGQRQVRLAVVVQQMVFPQASGIMFTADPVNGNRKVVSIDAGYGLGEALVSGLVNADNYKVKAGAIINKIIPAKALAIYTDEQGGTKTHDIEPDLQTAQVLTDTQIVQLATLGGKIEQHFGAPQDIEWCLADGEFYVVQSRPITTLYPLPEVTDADKHVYISVGHQQMMTDAMKPLGLSIWQLTASRPMYTAGGRLFVDIAAGLATAAGRQALMNTLGQSDPLVRDALETLMARENIEKPEADVTPLSAAPPPRPQIANDPAVAAKLVQQSRELMASLQQHLEGKHGAEVFSLILEDIRQLKQLLFEPDNIGAIMAVMSATLWLNQKMADWLGEKNAADVLSQSVTGNITAEMGLELMDVADVIRTYPEVVNYLEDTKQHNFLTGLDNLPGGLESRQAIEDYLIKYGMRCAGEIDITKIRWSENPAILIPLILTNIKTFAPGAAKQRYEQGLREAIAKEQELLVRLRELPDGETKATETAEMISLLRNFSGYREYPKYTMVSHYFAWKKALLKEAEQLVNAGLLEEKEDAFYLTFHEFQDAVRTQKLDDMLIAKRKEEHRLFEKLTPPRVMTSDGEVITGRYKPENLPAGAIAGLAVSSGIVEGRARVILKMEDADIQDGDILVTAFTDPSWTPLFVSIKGLITEVGGLMTHGSVIAREYGLPAVVGVENATRLIADGHRIRVNGTDGFVELL